MGLSFISAHFHGERLSLIKIQLAHPLLQPPRLLTRCGTRPGRPPSAHGLTCRGLKRSASATATSDKAVKDPAAAPATNTPSVPIVDLAVVSGRTGQIIGMHFFSPVPVQHLTEFIPALTTNHETLQRTRPFAARLGKQAVQAPDRSGFVVNAPPFPHLLHGFRMVESGRARPEDIDKRTEPAVPTPMGPLRLLDLGGMVAVGRLGCKRGRFHQYDARAVGRSPAARETGLDESGGRVRRVPALPPVHMVTTPGSRSVRTHSLATRRDWVRLRGLSGVMEHRHRLGVEASSSSPVSMSEGVVPVWLNSPFGANISAHPGCSRSVAAGHHGLGDIRPVSRGSPLRGTA
ncbi:3-hydroxyacyl-CoA dehydrogenase NAD-binding domain-containing protein [Streptomyces sp. NPDC005811]|uniref:3-hydroxyacyl-CoA dehydrogenase NAD-binding domain-containing protein n=1 Tax=Streptomyces sp. NPDC005811 TaxID=3154565 RepID=UPI0033CC4DEE